MEVFVARQPIFDKHEQVVGYELLYRNARVNSFPQVDGDTATVNVLVNSFLSIGIEEVAAGKPAFVNFTDNLLFSSVFDYLEPSKVIIEILEDVEITKQVVERVKQLKSKGYKIALDDFILNDQVKKNEEIFSLIDYIKIDFLATPLLERMEIENKMKDQYPQIQLLAEKVETRTQYNVAIHSGYTLFQGYFFEQPQILSTNEIPANALQYLQILSHLREEEPDINHLSESIERDISLTYKLLQLINQSNKRSKSKVRSIKQAVLLLGLTELRKWMYLLALREARLDLENDLIKEIMTSSLYRAKLCEKLAHYKHESNYPEFFLVGLFSLIDALLERPLNQILQHMPFSEQIVNTISGQNTAMAPYLNLCKAMNKVDWEKIELYSTELKIPLEVIMKFNREANEWVKASFEL